MIGEATAGQPALAATLAGVVLSLVGVYLNQRKSQTTLGRVDVHVDERTQSLQAQVKSLEREVGRLRKALAEVAVESKRTNDLILQLRDDRDHLRRILDAYGGRKAKQALRKSQR